MDQGLRVDLERLRLDAVHGGGGKDEWRLGQHFSENFFVKKARFFNGHKGGILPPFDEVVRAEFEGEYNGKGAMLLGQIGQQRAKAAEGDVEAKCQCFADDGADACPGK